MNGMSSPGNHFQGWNATSLTVVICSALALYNALELELLIFTTFHVYRGLYFWSLVLASFGVIPYVLGFMIEYFHLTKMALGIAIDTAGWSLMVTGQSFVLYSRLWLVFGGGHKRLLKGIKWMIILNGSTFHTLTIIVVYGSRFGSNQATFGHAYNVIERIQMSVFFVQEAVLSSIYIWKALDILRVSSQERCHRTLWQLFSINVIIIALDIALLSIEFASLHVIQQTIKGLVYCVKLKLELAILNKLIHVSSINARTNTLTFGDTNEFLDPTKTVWDITRFTPAFSSSMYRGPKWVADLDKSGLKRVESAYSPHDTNWARAKGHHHHSATLSDDQSYSSDVIEPCTTLRDPRLEGRERGSATDLLYADAVRRIASPG